MTVLSPSRAPPKANTRRPDYLVSLIAGDHGCKANMSLYYRFQISPPFALKSGVVTQRPIVVANLWYQNQAEVDITVSPGAPLWTSAAE
jgi:hypothetical protein